jgi:2-methylcitrate dehydratase PrpD
MQDPQGLSARLAAFVVETGFADLPDRTVEKTKQCLLDAIGVSLAASGLGEGCQAFVDLALTQGGKPTCAVFGMPHRLPVEAAAFVNGAMAHAIDYEDAHDGTLLHPNAPTVPAALAIAETMGGVSGKELIAALAIGCDVAVRLAQGLRASLPDFGWYPPPILAAFGATAAAAKLLRLNASQVRDAFSLVLCQATCSGEIKYSPNSVVRAIRDAFGARAGVGAALLAARGVTGFDAPFEGRAGFYAMFARGQYDPGAVMLDLGQRFEIENISFKPWPSCRGTHSAIEAALDLRDRHSINPVDIAAVDLRGGPILGMLDEPRASKRRPATAIDAKFSLPFTTATALVHGRVALDNFLPTSLADPRVLRVAEKVELEIDPVLPENDIRCAVKITDRFGATFSRSVLLPLGGPANPMSQSRLIDKFIDCARYASRPIQATQARQICDATLSLESIQDVARNFMPWIEGHAGVSQR